MSCFGNKRTVWLVIEYKGGNSMHLIVLFKVEYHPHSFNRRDVTSVDKLLDCIVIKLCLIVFVRCNNSKRGSVVSFGYLFIKVFNAH